jgi:hypothetical protein
MYQIDNFLKYQYLQIHFGTCTGKGPFSTEFCCVRNQGVARPQATLKHLYSLCGV